MSSLAIDVVAELVPGTAIPLVDAGVARIASIPVIVDSTNGNAGAVIGQGDRPAKSVSISFAIDVVAELVPGTAIPLMDAYVA